MTDPYQILGISHNANEEEVKTAYRELARKYHPDNYQGNPLADLANDKMKEINRAYDQVISNMRGQASYSGPSSQNASDQHNSHNGYAASQFADIRRLINSRRITEAEELLDGVPKHMRDAEWHFLKGSIQYSRGWLDDAFANFSHACNLAPNNDEYRSALNQLNWQRQTGRAPGMGSTQSRYGDNCSVCDVCMALYCANCCCDCLH